MTSRFSSRARLLISLCLLLAAPPLYVSSAAARSASSEFRTHVDKATQLYGAGDFEEAIQEMKAAYAIRQLPRLLFNIGSAYRKLGRSKEALEFYESYLRVEPNPKPEIKSELESYIKQTRAMQEMADRMRNPANPKESDGKTGAKTPPGDTTGPASRNQEPPPAGVRLDVTDSAQSDRSGAKPVYKKWWFWTIIGGVAVGAAVTVGVVLGTRPKEPDGIEIRDNRF